MVEQSQEQRIWQSARDKLHNYGEFAIDRLSELCDTETLCRAMGQTVDEFKKSITLKPTGVVTTGPGWKLIEMTCSTCCYITEIEEEMQNIACPKCYSNAWKPMPTKSEIKS